MPLEVLEVKQINDNLIRYIIQTDTGEYAVYKYKEEEIRFEDVYEMANGKEYDHPPDKVVADVIESYYILLETEPSR